MVYQISLTKYWEIENLCSFFNFRPHNNTIKHWSCSEHIKTRKRAKASTILKGAEESHSPLKKVGPQRFTESNLQEMRRRQREKTGPYTDKSRRHLYRGHSKRSWHTPRLNPRPRAHKFEEVGSASPNTVCGFCLLAPVEINVANAEMIRRLEFAGLSCLWLCLLLDILGSYYRSQN